MSILEQIKCESMSSLDDQLEDQIDDSLGQNLGGQEGQYNSPLSLNQAFSQTFNHNIQQDDAPKPLDRIQKFKSMFNAIEVIQPPPEKEIFPINEEKHGKESLTPGVNRLQGGKLKFGLLPNGNVQKSLSKRDIFQHKLRQHSSNLILNVKNSSTNSRTSMSSVSVSSSQSSPCFKNPNDQLRKTMINSSTNILEPSFEDKYEIEDKILGEGCSSVVKLCHLRSQKSGSEQQTFFSKGSPLKFKDQQTLKTLEEEFQNDLEGCFDINELNRLDNIQVQLNTNTEGNSNASTSQDYSGKSIRTNSENNSDLTLRMRNQQKRYAVKIIRSKDEEYQNIALKEFQILNSLDHPNIVKMPDAYINKQKETIYLVMELVEGYTLKKFLKKHLKVKGKESTNFGLSEQQCKSIITQLLHILEYLHSESVSLCHRDINPNNVMITEDKDGQIKVTLIDFNVSKRFKDQESGTKLLMMTNTGAAAFSAPEIHQDSSYCEKIDLWGVGCALYFSLFGQVPFPQSDQEKLVKAIVSGNYTKVEEQWLSISEDARDLLQKLLCIDSQQRLDVKEALKHPWLHQL